MVKYFQVRVVMQSVLLCPLRTSFVVGVHKLVAAGIEVDNVLQVRGWLVCFNFAAWCIPTVLKEDGRTWEFG